jgi:hydroxymethylglutaryl-CoA lyase
MIPTEDLVDLLNELGIPTGINLAALIEASLLAEDVVGHPLYGHLAKAGPRPRGEDLYPMDLPFIETEEQAQHFRKGAAAYEGARSPWAAPIESPERTALNLKKDERSGTA